MNGPKITVNDRVWAKCLRVISSTTELLAFAVIFNPPLPTIDRKEDCLFNSITEIPGRYHRPVVYIFPRLRAVPVAQYFLET